MKLKGFVRNLADGTVEILCEGAEASVSAFKAEISRRNVKGGIFSMNVTSIKEYPIERLPKETPSFEIDYEEEAKTPFEKTNLERLEIGSLLMADFRDSTGSKFDVMEQKYGDISRQMKILTEEFVSSNKWLAI